jgi:hypothetical protein
LRGRGREKEERKKEKADLISCLKSNRDSSRKKRAMAQGNYATQADAFARSDREDSASIESRVMDRRRRGVDNSVI